MGVVVTAILQSALAGIGLLMLPVLWLAACTKDTATVFSIQSMSKTGAKRELGPFSSTSCHHALSAASTPMWLGTMSSTILM